MVKSIRVGNLPAALSDALTVYAQDVIDRINDVGEQSSDKLRRITRATAPRSKRKDKYPFAFAENPAVNASYMGGDGDAWLISLFSAYDDLKTSAPAYALARPNQGTISNPRIAYHIVGKYK